MRESDEKPPTWGGFFVGCLVLCLLAACGVSAFWWISRAGDKDKEELQLVLFAPYWSAVKAGQFEKATEYWSDSWKEKKTAQQLSEAYQEVVKEHGALTAQRIHRVHGQISPGQVGEMKRVETILEFERGQRTTVIYHIVRPTSETSWRIDSSTTTGAGLGDGPW